MRNDWETLGALDPLWAVLSEPGTRFSNWNEDEFFATGEVYIGKVLPVLEALGLPARRQNALDFGCGVGRISRQLANHFDQVVGLDCSESMIASAKLKNSQLRNCEFIECQTPQLPFPDNHFDLVHTVIVLQHLPNQQAIFSYVREFVRILCPAGLLVFQVPDRIPLRKKIQLKRRLWAVLIKLGFPERFLYSNLNLHPIRMTGISQNEVKAMIAGNGCRVLRINADDGQAGPYIRSNTYFVAKSANPSQ